MICLSLFMLNLRLLQIIFLLIRIFFLQDLDVILHLIGDSEITMQGRLRNLCHEELLINYSVQGSCDFNCKPWQWVMGLWAKLDTFCTVSVGLWKSTCAVGHGCEEQLYTRIFEVVVLIIAFIICLSVTHSPSCACTLSIPRHWWDMGIVLDHPAVQDGEFN